jgi:hypothetical protein
VVREDQPFSAVEAASFRSLLSPNAPTPSADTIRRDIMVAYEEMKASIRNRLRSAGSKISLTLDCWTSPNSKAFMGITAHYIDNNWTLQSLLLDFVPLHGVQSGEDLCEVLVAKCKEFDILDKLLGITTDNAANLAKLLSCFENTCLSHNIAFKKKEQHVRCVAHVTNLAVQALLCALKAEPPITDPDPDEPTQTERLSCVAKLRHLVVSIRSSSKRRENFRGQCVVCKVPPKELLQDTRTRWNSTHAMIERACELQYPLSEMAKDNPDIPELSSEEWELLGLLPKSSKSSRRPPSR